MTVDDARRILGGFVPNATQAEQTTAYSVFWGWYNAENQRLRIAAEMRDKIKTYPVETAYDPRAEMYGYSPEAHATQEAAEELAAWAGGKAVFIPSAFRLYGLWCLELTNGEQVARLNAAQTIRYLSLYPPAVACGGIRGMLPFDWTVPATPSPFSPRT